MKIAVVGIGGTGSAALRFLAEEGHTAVGYERFCVGHTNGSSHGESRIIRYTYPDLLFTQMMGDAYPLWAALEEAAGEELYVRTGGLLFGPDRHPRLTDTAVALSETGHPFEALSSLQVMDRFPAVRLKSREVGIFQKDTGFLRASRCVRANARLAVTAGADLREETVVERTEQRGDQVLVHTAAGEEAFDRVILTAGAWMQQMLGDLAVPLKVTRQQVVYLRIGRNQSDFEVGRFPIWIDADMHHYGFPKDGVIEGVKMAEHEHGDVVAPGHDRTTVDAAYLQRMIRYGTRRFPDLAPEVTSSNTCLYTNTPNEDFIIDQLPGSPHVWMVSGCSGHGFKFTVLLGKIAAGLATGTEYARDRTRFLLESFAHG